MLKKRLCKIFKLLNIIPLFFLAQVVNAQYSTTESTGIDLALKSTSGEKIQGTISIDGKLEEREWADAPALNGFTQLYPNPGEKPSEQTTVKVLYDDNYLYIGMRMYDKYPDQIVANLGRKDDFQLHSDWAYIVIDSNNDRRTAFQFQINPAGVRRDGLFVNDNQQDNNWRGVWEAASNIDSEGWTTEIKIPFSQLGISNRRNEPFTIGINFGREIARHDERSFWAPVDPESGRFVSHSGYLRNVNLESALLGLEIVPYLLGEMESSPSADANPLIDSPETNLNGGVDIRYGLTNALTLNATINPDFGQVEVDPAVVNLTAFETFFPERRQFFTDGSAIFRFGEYQGVLRAFRLFSVPGNENLFYSRRIGRAPRGNAPSGSDFADIPNNTRILGAAKLVGRTNSGWSIGLIDAVTERTVGHFMMPNDESSTYTAEPFTNYAVARVSKDFKNGSSAIGFLGTAVNRDSFDRQYLLAPSNAYSFGFDGRHRFIDNRYEIVGWLALSSVNGSQEAMANIQRAPGRYFQRPDATHLNFDPNLSSIDGFSSGLNIAKIAGNWRTGLNLETRSPGFEINDLGYLFDTDWTLIGSHIGYNHYQPGRIIRQWNLFANLHSAWNYGSNRLESGANLNGAVNFQNQWSLNGGIAHNIDGLDTDMLRGGPSVKTNSKSLLWMNIATDRRRTLNAIFSTNYTVEHGTGGRTVTVLPNIEIRPNTWITLRTGPLVRWMSNPWQWVGSTQMEDGERIYVVGNVDQTTFSMNFRLSVSPMPDLSIDLYLQPLASDNAFSDYRYLGNPHSSDFDNRFILYDESDLEKENGNIHFTRNDQSFSLPDPDFSFISLRGNAVIRWEFLPGSELFFVWQQNRNRADALMEDMTPGGIYNRTIAIQPQNNFLVKVRYWVGK